jgi:hypothetical protein
MKAKKTGTRSAANSYMVKGSDLRNRMQQAVRQWAILLKTAFLAAGNSDFDV